MSRKSVKTELFYNNFAVEFDSRMNKYDLQRRLDIVFNKLLPKSIAGKRLLDAGCGTGHFSQQAVKKGARVTSMDIGENLLEKVSEKCNSERVVGSVLDMQFEDNYFDFIISSEVIEHTNAPYKAIGELYRVLKPNGILALTVPNQFWKWSCVLANTLKIRPYEGIENWVGYSGLKRELEAAGFSILHYRGFHLLPFQINFLHPFLLFMDKFGDKAGMIYINIATSCRKQVL